MPTVLSCSAFVGLIACSGGGTPAFHPHGGVRRDAAFRVVGSASANALRRTAAIRLRAGNVVRRPRCELPEPRLQRCFSALGRNQFGGGRGHRSQAGLSGYVHHLPDSPSGRRRSGSKSSRVRQHQRRPFGLLAHCGAVRGVRDGAHGFFSRRTLQLRPADRRASCELDSVGRRAATAATAMPVVLAGLHRARRSATGLLKLGKADRDR
jgi:hypothetical protein